MMHQFKLPITLVSLLFFAVACTHKTEDAAKVKHQASETNKATLQEIMLYVIDPNVDALWNAVTTTVTKEGVVEKRPETEEEWIKLKGHAITLQEAGHLLLLKGRKVAAEGVSTSIHPVELSPAEIEKLIEANKKDFNKRAENLNRVASLAIKAIDARDAVALEKVGGQIEHACESCHSTFWYPNDQVPKASSNIGLQSKNVTYLALRNH